MQKYNCGPSHGTGSSPSVLPAEFTDQCLESADKNDEAESVVLHMEEHDLILHSNIFQLIRKWWITFHMGSQRDINVRQ